MDSKNKEIVKLTQKLVQIPSENPLGNEKEISKFIYSWFKKNKIEAEMMEVLPDRPNVIARIKGGNNKNSLLLLAHTDTVPAGKGWKNNAFSGRIIDGKLYGRGSADMKSGLAAAMMAIKKIKESGEKLQGDLIVAAVVDEEAIDYLGAQSLVKNNIVDKNTFIVCIEPTGLDLCKAQKGTVWYKAETFGKNAHGGNPQFGADAVHAMSIFLKNIKDCVNQLPYYQEHIGKATITIGKIKGGLKVNIVPDYCLAELDLRIPTPLDTFKADRMLDDIMKKSASQVEGVTGKVTRFGAERDPVEAQDKSVIVQGLKSAYKEIMGEEVKIKGFTAYTDAGIIATMTKNNNCIIFGPGKLCNTHSVDEFVEIKEIENAEKVLVSLVIKTLK